MNYYFLTHVLSIIFRTISTKTAYELTFQKIDKYFVKKFHATASRDSNCGLPCHAEPSMIMLELLGNNAGGNQVYLEGRSHGKTAVLTSFRCSHFPCEAPGTLKILSMAEVTRRDAEEIPP
jgi:hypothetical protein